MCCQCFVAKTAPSFEPTAWRQVWRHTANISKLNHETKVSLSDHKAFTISLPGKKEKPGNLWGEFFPRKITSAFSIFFLFLASHLNFSASANGASDPPDQQRKSFWTPWTYGEFILTTFHIIKNSHRRSNRVAVWFCICSDGFFHWLTDQNDESSFTNPSAAWLPRAVGPGKAMTSFKLWPFSNSKKKHPEKGRKIG